MTDLFRPWRYRVPLAARGREAADAYCCARCAALVIDTVQHSRWHGAVDSNATTEVAR